MGVCSSKSTTDNVILVTPPPAVTENADVNAVELMMSSSAPAAAAAAKLPRQPPKQPPKLPPKQPPKQPPAQGTPLSMHSTPRPTPRAAKEADGTPTYLRPTAASKSAARQRPTHGVDSDKGKEGDAEAKALIQAAERRRAVKN